MARTQKALWIAGFVCLAIIFIWKALTVYTEWLWISNVGYRSVFITIYKTRIALAALVGVPFFFWLWWNCRIARRSTSDDITFIGKRLLPPAERATIEQHIDKAILGVAILVAVVAAILASHRALPFLQFTHSTPFTADDGSVLSDPIFGREIAFYVFRLPFIQYVWGVFFQGILIALVLVCLVYLYEESLRIVPGTVHLAPPARLHAFSLLAAAFVCKAAGYWLDRFRLLTTQPGQEKVYGIGYTDFYARVPLYYALIAVALVCAVVTVIAIRRLSVRAVGMAIAGLLIFSGLGKFAAPAAVQAILVRPSELQREERFLRYNIDYTRDAYGLADVRLQPYDVTPLTSAEVAANPATINNLRLWDDRPLETVANQRHQLRTYYEFADVDVDRYTIDGQMRQVMLAARQLNVEDLPSGTWINRHMQYTHGHGFVLAPVNETTLAGEPNFFVKDIPPPYPPPEGMAAVAVPAARAGLYYQVAVEREAPLGAPVMGAPEGPGEEAAPPPPPAEAPQPTGPRPARRGARPLELVKTTTDFCIVGARDDELDYPLGGAGNAYTRYSGDGGVAVSSYFRRLAFFARFRAWPILFSSSIVHDTSRIMMHRTVHERIGAIAPFLLLDRDPYLVIADEKLQWITDGYTATSRYPYSEQPMIGGQSLNVNYLRNSVKVCLDAYDGTVTFYVFDEQDPVLQTYRKIFPEVFKGKDEMSESLMAHIRYPEGLFRIQSQMYQLYHMTDVPTFYQQEDRWSFPFEEFAGRQQVMESYYVVMTLPERAKGGGGNPGAEEFLLMTPFTPYGKSDKNMLAWMCARCDPEHYGELIVYLFPKSEVIDGPMLIEADINADPDISKNYTLWNDSGSRVIKGNLLVIPIEDSILYVEPLYVQSEFAPIPQLKMVILGANDNIAWGMTLDEALAKMFGTEAVRAAPSARRPVGVAPAGAEVPSALMELARQIRARYSRAQGLLRGGDFAGYDREQKEIGRLIEQLVDEMESTRQGGPAPAQPPTSD